MNCPQCTKSMQDVVVDVGFGISVASRRCGACGFHVTDDTKLNAALGVLRQQLAKDVSLVQVGNGVGIRFPNTIVDLLLLKKGQRVHLVPERDGIRVVV